MIQRSRRQRAADRDDAEVFSLHKRLGSRSAWHRRLLRASLGSLLASIVTVALAWPLWQQIAALGLGFLAGLLLPVRGHSQRALVRIREQAGLSYETALERSGTPDPFGLSTDVMQRARLTTRDVRGPDHPAWWLPALAAAAALLLLPAAATRSGANRIGADEPAAVAEAPAPDAAVEDAASAPAPPTPAPDRAQAAPSDAAPTGAADQEASSQAPGAGMSDQETLSRYLQELRERPAGDPGTERGESAEAVQPRDGSPSVADRQQGDGRAENQPSEARTGEAGEEGAGAESQDRQAGESGEQADGMRPNDAQEPGQAGAEPKPGEESQDAAGLQATGDPGDGERGRADQGLQPGEGGVDEGATAGNQAGETTASGMPAPAPGTQPEFLEGVLRPGPETPGGTIRLPGSTDVELPPGTSVSSYERAAEQALTEGNVPLEYQEIIRRYFR